MSLAACPPSRSLQTADRAASGWEGWLRSAWSRWARTKDTTNESWDAAKDSARRWACVGSGGSEWGGGEGWSAAPSAAAAHRLLWSRSPRSPG